MDGLTYLAFNSQSSNAITLSSGDTTDTFFRVRFDKPLVFSTDVDVALASLSINAAVQKRPNGKSKAALDVFDAFVICSLVQPSTLVGGKATGLLRRVTLNQTNSRDDITISDLRFLRCTTRSIQEVVLRVVTGGFQKSFSDGSDQPEQLVSIQEPNGSFPVSTTDDQRRNPVSVTLAFRPRQRLPTDGVGEGQMIR